GAPLVGSKVVLEARRYPFGGPFAELATATTGLDGRFSFEHAFDRNHQVRVLAPSSGDFSAVKVIYVFPGSNLTFRLVHRNVIRVTQTYTTPRDMRLTKPTFFYVGPRGTRSAPLAARARTRRIRRGRFDSGSGGRLRVSVIDNYIARAQVLIPEAWHGRFRYASCFPYNAGMGNPKIGCPRIRYRF
ncbi:MAG: hypothetical protein M3O90_10400, partial [Actinomycetota bacterium]|nr:hypothetical protein [Actinomycetota bacterium]